MWRVLIDFFPSITSNIWLLLIYSLIQFIDSVKEGGIWSTLCFQLLPEAPAALKTHTSEDADVKYEVNYDCIQSEAFTAAARRNTKSHQLTSCFTKDSILRSEFIKCCDKIIKLIIRLMFWLRKDHYIVSVSINSSLE